MELLLQFLLDADEQEDIRHRKFSHHVYVAAFGQGVSGNRAEDAEPDDTVFILVCFLEPTHIVYHFVSFHLFPPMFTSTIVIVSFPKMSTTLTASLRRPGGHSWKTLVSSIERSFLVRKD